MSKSTKFEDRVREVVDPELHDIRERFLDDDWREHEHPTEYGGAYGKSGLKSEKAKSDNLQLPDLGKGGFNLDDLPQNVKDLLNEQLPDDMAGRLKWLDDAVKQSTGKSLPQWSFDQFTDSAIPEQMLKGIMYALIGKALGISPFLTLTWRVLTDSELQEGISKGAALIGMYDLMKGSQRELDAILLKLESEVLASDSRSASNSETIKNEVRKAQQRLKLNDELMKRGLTQLQQQGIDTEQYLKNVDESVKNQTLILEDKAKKLEDENLQLRIEIERLKEHIDQGLNKSQQELIDAYKKTINEAYDFLQHDYNNTSEDYRKLWQRWLEQLKNLDSYYLPLTYEEVHGLNQKLLGLQPEQTAARAMAASTDTAILLAEMKQLRGLLRQASGYSGRIPEYCA